MKRLIGWFTTLGISMLVFAPAPAVAAGFSNTAQSATATAMGGVGAANPHEPNASFFNPALMSEHDGFNAYVGNSNIFPSTTYEPEGGGDVVSTNPSYFPPPNAHVSYTINEDLSVGLGATFPWGLGISWDEEWRGREEIQSQSLQTLVVNPVTAYEIGDTGLTIAAGPQVAFSSLELNRRIILNSETEIQTNLGGTGRGYGGIGGLLFEPNDSLTFGLNYRSSMKVNYEGRAHFENEEKTAFESRFVDGKVSTSLTIPHLLAVGAGWQLGRLFLELDLNYTTWSTYDRIKIDFKKDKPQETSTIVNNWQNAGAVRLGAQYEVIDRLPLRLGLAFDGTPIPDDTVNASLPGNDRTVATLGGGYTLTNGLRFDAAYKLVSTIPRDIQNDRAPNGTYQTTAHVLGVNVGYGY